MFKSGTSGGGGEQHGGGGKEEDKGGVGRREPHGGRHRGEAEGGKEEKQRGKIQWDVKSRQCGGNGIEENTLEEKWKRNGRGIEREQKRERWVGGQVTQEVPTQ